MAKENVKKFFEKLAKDEELKKALAAAQTDALIAVAKKAGFDFTIEELTSQTKADSKEISDEALEGVAGGWFHFGWAKEQE
ncbi:MAG: Nif11-like leader peptide family natural product precursor [Treponema sp.]|nr:Nif11-like leader peptide family natural product precursor [Treponema sp.]